MSRPEHDPDIEHEPHLRHRPAQADASESAVDKTLQREGARGGVARQRATQSVFDEPQTVRPSDAPPPVIDRDFFCAHCGYNLRGAAYGRPCPKCGQTEPIDYAHWLVRKRAAVTEAGSWTAALLAALVGGPLAVFGAIWAGGGALTIIVFGPVAEEVLKVAAVTIIVETRPYLFKHASQIRLAAIAGALGFAVIENLLYLLVYIPDPTTLLTVWRWTVCTALHVGCTTIAVRGVIRVWRRTDELLVKPDLGPALVWLVPAMIVHGTYNSVAVLMEAAGFDF